MMQKRLADAYATCRQRLADRNLHLDVVTDFETIDDIVEAVGKPYLTPHLAALDNSFTEENCFWALASLNGNIVIAGGVRYDQLGEERLSSFWERQVRQYYRNYPGPPALHVDPMLDRMLPGDSICYFGDLISETRPGSQTDLKHFANAMLMLAGLKWGPDACCAFLSDRHAKRQAVFHYGFLSAGLHTHRWSNPPYPRSDDEMMVYSTRNQLQVLANEIVREDVRSKKSGQVNREAAQSNRSERIVDLSHQRHKAAV